MTEIIVALIAAIGAVMVARINVMPHINNKSDNNNNDNQDENGFILVDPPFGREDEVVIVPIGDDENEYEYDETISNDSIF